MFSGVGGNSVTFGCIATKKSLGGGCVGCLANTNHESRPVS